MNELALAERACDAETSPYRSLPFLLLGVAHEVEAQMEEALAPVGLSLAKHRLLSKLVEAGEPLPLSCLADRCSCVRSNMTQLVDRLESDRLVERRSDARDRRSVQAGITELGLARQAEGAERLRAVERECFARLSADDRQSLERLVGLVREAL